MVGERDEPLDPRALLGEAAIARREGRPADAEAVYRRWMSLAPDDPAPRYGLALLLLARGAFEEGWALYAARTGVPETGVRAPPVPYDAWRGQPVGSLLLWPEQGLGDQIMYARYVRELTAHGVEVTLICAPSLVRLLAPLAATVLPAEGTLSVPRREAWALIGSLPHLVGMVPATPYLRGGEGGRGVGVMTSGNPGHVNDRNRSLPPDIAQELRSLGRDLAPEATGARDFQDTADIVADLALVITVDTAVAHLAGAMGKPTWLLLPHEGEWRWGRDPTRTHWYPSVRLYRQPAPGDWRAVIDRVKADLGDRSPI
jgi:hypothetical protein